MKNLFNFPRRRLFFKLQKQAEIRHKKEFYSRYIMEDYDTAKWIVTNEPKKRNRILCRLFKEAF